MFVERDTAIVVQLPAPGGERRVVTLHPSLAGRYTSLVAGVAPAIELALGPAVAANRVAAAREAPPELVLRPWRHERAVFARRLSALARSSGCLVFADVRDCYGSIAPRVVERSLVDLGAAPDRAAEVGRLLRRLGGLGIQGLPVGPDASAVLANAVLLIVDRALGRAGLSHLRWVDDVVIACDTPEWTADSLVIVRRALAEIGLEPNEEKTRVVLDPSSLRSAFVSHARARTGVG